MIICRLTAIAMLFLYLMIPFGNQLSDFIHFSSHVVNGLHGSPDMHSASDHHQHDAHGFDHHTHGALTVFDAIIDLAKEVPQKESIQNVDCDKHLTYDFPNFSTDIYSVSPFILSHTAADILLAHVNIVSPPPRA
jgi:hypothetical protein